MPAPSRVNLATRVFDAVALASLVLAVLAFGSYPAWLAGFAVAAFCALGALHIVGRVLSGHSVFDFSPGLTWSVAALALWLLALVGADMCLGTASGRVPALSLRQIPFGGAFLAAGLLGTRWRGERGLRMLLTVLAFLGGALATAALADRFHLVTLTPAQLDSQVRSSGLLISPNRFAVVQALCCAGALGMALATARDASAWSHRRRAQVALHAFLALLIGCSLAFSLSRLTIAVVGCGGALAGMCWLAWIRRPGDRRRFSELSRADQAQAVAIQCLPVVCLLGWLAWAMGFGGESLTARFKSLGVATAQANSYDRWIAMQAGWRMLRARPGLGWGLGNFEYAFTAWQPAELTGRWNRLHNDWLQLGVEAGAPALALALIATFFWWRGWFRGMRAAGSESSALLRLLPAIGIFTLLVCALADFPFRELGVALPFFMLAGALSGGAHVANASPLRNRIASLALVPALLAGGFVSARNAAAIASSPWFGQRYAPPALGVDYDAWARAAERDPSEPLLHYFAADTVAENPLAGKTLAERALASAARGAALSPYDFHMPLTSALLLDGLGRTAEAEPLFAQAVALAPMDSFVRLHAGLFCLRHRAEPFQPGSFQRAEGLRQALDHFRIVLPREPHYENQILTWLDEAGMDAGECVEVWPEDSGAGLLRRARYLYDANVYNRAVEELEKYRGLRSRIGVPAECWYYLLGGAVAGRTGLGDNLIEAWRHVLNERCLARDPQAENWLAGQLATLDPALVERFAGAAEDGMKGLPNVAYAAAVRMSAAGRTFEALRFIERTGGETAALQRLWAELSLGVGDVGGAEAHARRALNYDRDSLAAWHAEFSQRIAQQSKRRKQDGR